MWSGDFHVPLVWIDLLNMVGMVFNCSQRIRVCHPCEVCVGTSYMNNDVVVLVVL